MSKNRTEKSRYPSRYGGGWISPAQYIVECLCFLIARQEKKELRDKFWNDKSWNVLFRNQISAANKLLEKYPAEVILDTLRDRRCWKLRSLRANFLLGPILEEKKKIYDRKQSNITETEKTPTNEQPRKVQKKKKTTLEKLREL